MRKNITLSAKTNEYLEKLQKIYNKKFQGSNVMQSWIISQAIDRMYQNEIKNVKED